MSCPPEIPPALRALLVRLLEKDPRRRLRDIGDARLALEDLQANATVLEVPRAPAAAPRPGAPLARRGCRGPSPRSPLAPRWGWRRRRA